MKQKQPKHCICGRRPELNKIKGNHNHPSVWEIKAGAICLLVIALILFWFWPDALWYFVVGIVGLTILIIIAKRLRGHSLFCAVRDGPMVTLGLAANILEAINPLNWF
jgi:hypothetical protein